jgi:hypothetical protein
MLSETYEFKALIITLYDKSIYFLFKISYKYYHGKIQLLMFNLQSINIILIFTCAKIIYFYIIYQKKFKY